MMARLRLIEFAPSFGDTATTWSYPARTSHRGIPEARRQELGIGDGLVRLSVGLEAGDDLIDDLAGALYQ
jgi:cystathionine beta-lyase/cystathionine gamma-synthase